MEADQITIFTLVQGTVIIYGGGGGGLCGWGGGWRREDLKFSVQANLFRASIIAL